MSRKGLRGQVTAAGVLIALALAGPIASASACSGARQTPPQLTKAEAKRAVICLINKRRSHFHAQRLHGNSLLTEAAEGHSTSMNTLNYFAHDSSSDGSPVSRINSTGYMSGATSWMVGENLNWGVGEMASPKSTVAAWMGSADHRSILLSRSFREVGIGFVTGSPTGSEETAAAIYTADFGYRR